MRIARNRNSEIICYTKTKNEYLEHIRKSFDLKLPNSAFAKIINFENFTGIYSVHKLTGENKMQS